jgi:hypothetical protein
LSPQEISFIVTPTVATHTAAAPQPLRTYTPRTYLRCGEILGNAIAASGISIFRTR